MKIRIDLTKINKTDEGRMAFSDVLFILYEEVGDLVFDCLAIACTGLFNEKYHREFLFSEECVSNEIKYHCFGYWWVVDKANISCPQLYYPGWVKYCLTTKNALGFAAWLKICCESIGIGEWEVNLKDQAMAFGYFDGIRDTYKNTKSDPFYDIDKKKRTVLVRDGWYGENIK
jgi:hypothetical protein